MDDVKIRMAKDGAFPVNDEMAGLVPLASETEQVVLTQDIKDNGLRMPIALWRGEVIDGRCRQKALVMLKQPITYFELKDKLSKEEVRTYVKSVNTRRNLTVTQKVISATKEYLREGNKMAVANMAKSWGVGELTLKNAIYISRSNPQMVNDLFNGGSVTITNSAGELVQSNKVTAIYAYLKKLEEKVVEVSAIEAYGWKENSYITTQAGKEWYYRTIKDLGIGDPAITHLVAELANFKFPKNDIDEIWKPLVS